MNLKQYLRENNITQSEFARMLGVTRGSVYGICAGINNPSYALATAICKLTNGLIKIHEIRKCTHTCGEGCLCSRGKL